MSKIELLNNSRGSCLNKTTQNSFPLSHTTINDKNDMRNSQSRLVKGSKSRGSKAPRYSCCEARLSNARLPDIPCPPAQEEKAAHGGFPRIHTVPSDITGLA